MRKLVIGLVGTVAFLVALILIVPQFVNWSAYRDEIASAASGAVGRTVTIAGPVGLRLLPAPALSVEDVRVAAPPGFSGAEMAGLERLDVRIALAPLLSGRIQVESVALVRPHVVVERDPSGAFNWSPPASADPASAVPTPTDGAAPSVGPPPSDMMGFSGADGLVGTLSFDQIAVEDARLTYDDRVRGTRETVSGIDLNIVAGSVTGPFQITGEATTRGVPIRIEATTGRFATGVAVPLRLSLGLPGGEPERMSGLRFAGIIGNGNDPSPNGERPNDAAPGGGNGGDGGNGSPALRGDLRVETPDLSRMIGPFLEPFAITLDPPVAERLNRPFAAHATVEAAADRARLGNLELTLGDAAASGHAGFGVDRDGRTQGELTLALNRLDLDGWLPAAKAPVSAKTPAPTTSPPSAEGGGGAAGRGGGAAGEAPRPVVGGGFELPKDVTFRVDLSVDAAGLSGGVVRQIRLEAALDQGTATITRLSALLPGGSQIAAAGSLGAVGGAPKLDLRVEATSDNLRAALEWLRVDTARIPAERLRKTVLVTTVSAKPDRVELTDLDLELDTSRITGAIAVERRDRPAIGARLDLDSLNLDAYLPTASDAAPPAAENGAKAPEATPTPKDQPAGTSPIAALDLMDINLEATVGRLTVGGDAIRDIRVNLTAAAGAIEAREISFKDWAGIGARVSGQAASLSPLRNAHVTINADAQSLAPFARAAPFGIVWPADLPPPDALGRVTLQARIAGDRERVAIESALEAAGATVELGGDLTHPTDLMSGAGVGRSAIDLTGRVRHPDADAALALIGARAPSGPGPLDLYAHLTAEGSKAALSDIEGMIGTTPVAGDIRIDRAGDRPRVEANLRAGVIDIARLGGGNGGGTAEGKRPAAKGGAAAPPKTDDAIDLSPLNSLDGNFKATIERLDLDGVTLDRLAATAQLDDGALTVDRFDADLMKGRVGGRAVVSAPRGDQPSRVAVAATAEGLVPTKEIPVGPLALTSGVVGGEIDVSATGATLDAWVNQLTGTARVAVRNGVLRGIDLAAIRDLFKGEGRPRDLIQRLTKGLRDGETGFANLDGSFRIDHGTVETNDTRMESVPASVSAVGRVNLPERSMDMTLTVDLLAIDPPPPPISVHLKGPLGSPERIVDQDALRRMVIERATDEALRRAIPDGGDAAPLKDAIQKPLGDLLRRLGR